MTTTTGKLIGMIKFSVWCSRVLAGASNDFEKRSLEGSKRRLLRRVRMGVCFLRRSAQAAKRAGSSNCSSAFAPRTRHKDVPRAPVREEELASTALDPRRGTIFEQHRARALRDGEL